MKCKWGQAGNCQYLYGKRVVGKSVPGQSEVRSGVGVVGVKKTCGHGGWGRWKMEPTQSSETSAFNTQTPGKYPEDNLSCIICCLESKNKHSFGVVTWPLCGEVRKTTKDFDEIRWSVLETPLAQFPEFV
jgi:hypothetical protein